MAAVEGFTGVAVTLLGAILAAVAMDGVAAVMGGVAVTGAAGTAVVAGMDGVGTVGDMGALGMVAVRIGMAVLPTGGGVTRTRMVTVMVGDSASGQGSPVVSLSRRRPAVPGCLRTGGDELLLVRGIRRSGTGGEESGRAGARPYRVLPHFCDERARNRYHLRPSAVRFGGNP
jgi:hypothetical protein